MSQAESLIYFQGEAMIVKLQGIQFYLLIGKWILIEQNL